ncbi:MAG: DUF1552 domain-containing protein [Pirellulaceae bacterium]|nr:DUF1552 domain-containing protein [Pirellulaceae bacterium]
MIKFKKSRIARRNFLQGAGVALALPWLESVTRSTANAQGVNPRTQKPRRFLGICNNLGLLPEEFFPKGVGRDYEPSLYLKLLQEHRQDFTVFSGVSHPNVDGGHPSDISFLTAAPHPASSSFRNSISLDQHISEHVGNQTRFPSLTLAVNSGSRSLSWTGTGVAIPPEESAAALFKQLFLQGNATEVEAQVRKLDTGRSILDAIADQTQDLERRVNNQDRGRLEQYFSSVRDLESRLLAARQWESKAKPKVDVEPPTDPTNPAQYMSKVRLMYESVKLAFQTDSTRAVTLMLNSVGTPVVEIPGQKISDGYHNLSHHGKSEEKLTQLRIIDLEHMKLLNQFFADLKSVKEEDESLLDRSMILYGSNLGDANAHSTTNMPILLAGGGFKHGQHLVFDPQQNYPLPNLFVSILQRMGIEQDKFASSTGTMRGLEST